MDPKSEKLQELLKNAQQMQQEMGKVQETLGRKTVEGSAGGGMVSAVANGQQQLVSIQIDSSIIDRDESEMLQDLIVAAVNQALGKAQALAQEEMAKVAGGFSLQLPGMPE